MGDMLLGMPAEESVAFCSVMELVRFCTYALVRVGDLWQRLTDMSCLFELLGVCLCATCRVSPFASDFLRFLWLPRSPATSSLRTSSSAHRRPTGHGRHELGTLVLPRCSPPGGPAAVIRAAS